VPAAQRYTAPLQQARGEGGRWLKIPFDARETFGQARPPVRGTINGTPIRARLTVYGGETYLGLRREIRDAAGIEVGDDGASHERPQPRTAPAARTPRTVKFPGPCTAPRYGAAIHLIVPLRQDWTSRPVALSAV
jgi:uncharacterized protein DUF1905